MDLSQGNLNRLADAGLWSELLALLDSAGEERHRVTKILVLEAPAEIAVRVLDRFPETGRAGFPLWEMLATVRSWRELAPHLHEQRVRYLAAYTRVLHGEDLSSEPDLDPMVFGAPFVLQLWEMEHWYFSDLPSHGRFSFSCGRTSFPPPPTDPSPLPVGEIPEISHEVVDVLPLDMWAQVRAFQGIAWQAASMAASPWAGADRKERLRFSSPYHNPDLRSAGPAPEPDRVRTGQEFPFSAVFPALVELFAGEDAYSNGVGRALGRLEVWRMLAAMAGAEHPADLAVITALVDRLRCVGWQEPDEGMISQLFVAIEDPAQGTSWTLTGEDED